MADFSRWFNLTFLKCSFVLIKANHKDKDPIMKKSGVYKIDCKQCEKVYIGQTKRTNRCGGMMFKSIDKKKLRNEDKRTF